MSFVLGPDVSWDPESGFEEPILQCLSNWRTSIAVRLSLRVHTVELRLAGKDGFRLSTCSSCQLKLLSLAFESEEHCL